MADFHKVLRPNHDQSKLRLSEEWRTHFREYTLDVSSSHLNVKININISMQKYRAFHRFGHAKFNYSDLILGSSQYSLLPQLPQKMVLNLKKDKLD
jgi:hypothetical protein